jgi:two-component system OmpR family sensor kinase
VFDRFYRVNKSSTSDDGGAGLGLSIVQSIITALGGRIDLESTPGEGSVFRVSLPISANGNSRQELGENPDVE